jgi:eukaryotic-like serine/threonine-protein kinase
MSSRPPIPPDAKNRNGDNKPSSPVMDDAATKVTGSALEIPLELDEIEELSIEALEPIPAGGDGADKASPGKNKPDEYQPVDNRIFGRFELLIEMGRGGMATLFLARIQGPSNFEKLLAIKKIHDHLAHEDQFVRMFMDEARIAAMIHHPNVATIFDMGRIDKSYFIAMEYVHGQDLTDILKVAGRKRANFPWTHAVRIIADTAAGLHSAHELKNQEGQPLNVVHRDVSPQNILVSYDGNTKVVDFGIAFAAEKLETTQAGTLKGKVGYMSPEQAMGEEVDRRSDIFSLGIVLWECVCIRRLFKEANEGATLLRVRDADVAKPRSVRPEIPVELERIIMKALAKDRKDRYDTAEEFGDALESLLVAKGEVIRPKKIAKMLDDLFFDRKKLKDKQLKVALKWTGSNPIKGVGMGATGTHSLVLQTDPHTTNVTVVRPWSSLAIIVGSIAAVAIVALILIRPFGSWSGEKRPPPAKPVAAAHMVPPPMRPKPLSADVLLKITVNPALASVEVLYQKKKYLGPLFQMTVPRSQKAETIQVSAPGYFPQTLVLVPNRNNDLPVTLMMLPKVKPRVRPRPMIRRRWTPMRRRNKLKDIDWD